MIPCLYWNLQGTYLPMDAGKGDLIHLKDATTWKLQSKIESGWLTPA